MTLSMQHNVNENARPAGRITPLVLFLSFALSLLLKLYIFKVGSPFVTIDDNTLFEGGFLVWFGQAPPQRMFLESWVCGLSCLATYVVKMISTGNVAALGVNLIADAYRDFYGHPDMYVHNYRVLMILVDMVTAYFVYRVGRQILGRDCWHGWGAVLVCLLYLFSFNTIWCDIVARPDTLTVLFAILGLFFYYKSDFGGRIEWFLIAAVSFGLAAGMKLHAAFFAIFIALDLLRVHGVKKGFAKASCLAFVSFFFFCFAAGSLFADPLTYIKLRMANAIDDASPWIQWGDQFVTMLRGTGWIIVPGVLSGLWLVMSNRNRAIEQESGQRVKSIVFQSMCWLFLFSCIRQLRAYWMLPVLPLFYMVAVYAVSRLQKTKIAALLAIVSLLIMGYQSYAQMQEFRTVHFNELRQWMRENAIDKQVYIFGFEALVLPKNTVCIQNKVRVLRQALDDTSAEGLPFTLRHLKNWEERSRLVLFDMLGYEFEPGYEYYGFHSTPLELYAGVLSLEEMSYVLVQEHFSLSDKPEVEILLQQQFHLVAEVTGAGGGGAGLHYKVYERL